jgi:hypothetical protein
LRANSDSSPEFETVVTKSGRKGESMIFTEFWLQFLNWNINKARETKYTILSEFWLQFLNWNINKAGETKYTILSEFWLQFLHWNINKAGGTEYTILSEFWFQSLNKSSGNKAGKKKWDPRSLADLDSDPWIEALETKPGRKSESMILSEAWFQS